MASLKTTFDSLTLAATLCEMAPYVGGKVQKVVQPDANTIHLHLYAASKESVLLLTCDPVFARIHFVTKRAGGQQPMPQFCAALRAKLDGARLESIRQVGFDRIAQLDFDGPNGPHRLVAELMGKHSNLILTSANGKIEAACKWVSASKSKRPILPGRAYQPPPFAVRKSLLEAGEGDELDDLEGASPFLRKLIQREARGFLARIQQAVANCEFQPVYAPGVGAYPLSIKAFGVEELLRPTISIALEQHFDQAIAVAAADALRRSLLVQLRRVLLAREVAAQDLGQALDAAKRASEFQLRGELILAHAHEIDPGSAQLQTEDYEGNPVLIGLDPELTPLENAERLFKKAKQAKSRGPFVREQLNRMLADIRDLTSLIALVDIEERLEKLDGLREQAAKRKWLIGRPPQTRRKEDRPYEGHRVREALGPGGVMVLYGENAEANDYLIVRVARPNDYWLHVRGSQSAHAVIPTQNHPEKISREVLEFAARVVVQNSPSKHSGYVPVDYTLRKYVRKPKGSAKGMAVYTHEKTLHIEAKAG